MSKEKNSFTAIKLTLFFWSKKKILIASILISALAAIIFSSPFFIPPKYKSTVILFSASTNSVSRALLSQNQSSKENLLQFGEEENAEQLLQILNSSKIRDRIIKKYDLANHYKIDTTSKFKNTTLFKEYESNITYRRTENMAIEIKVMDTDPIMASNIANDISALLDTVKINMQKERAIHGFQIVKKEYQRLQNEIKIQEDSMTKLREKGINDYESQAEMVNMQLAKEIAKNANSAAVKELNKKLDILTKYGGPYVSLRDALLYEKKGLVTTKEQYDKAKIDAEEDLPQSFIVDKAYPAEKKSYPVRWIIVLVAVMSSFLITAFSLVIIDGVKKETKKK